MGVILISILYTILGFSSFIPCIYAAINADNSGYYKYKGYGDVGEVSKILWMKTNDRYQVWVKLSWLVAVYAVSAALDLVSVVTGAYP